MSIKDDLMDRSITAAIQKDDARRQQRKMTKDDFGGDDFYPVGLGFMTAQDPELAKYQRAMPGKPLTKPPGYYLTSYEGSPCKPIEDYDMAPFKYKQKGIDTDKFRKECLEDEGKS